VAISRRIRNERLNTIDMGITGNQVFTKSLTNDSIQILEADGIALVSVLCTSSTGGTILGTGTVGGVASGSINVAENTAVTIGTSSGFPIDDLTIAAPSGCTLEITGVFG